MVNENIIGDGENMQLNMSSCIGKGKLKTNPDVWGCYTRLKENEQFLNRLAFIAYKNEKMGKMYNT